jgi:hypothetical protein
VQITTGFSRGSQRRRSFDIRSGAARAGAPRSTCRHPPHARALRATAVAEVVRSRDTWGIGSLQRGSYSNAALRMPNVANPSEASTRRPTHARPTTKRMRMASPDLQDRIDKQTRHSVCAMDEPTCQEYYRCSRRPRLGRSQPCVLTEAARRLATGQAAYFGAPMANRWSSVRMKIRPFEMAGDAIMRSPRSLRAMTSGVRPARITIVSPFSLTK